MAEGVFDCHEKESVIGAPRSAVPKPDQIPLWEDHEQDQPKPAPRCRAVCKHLVSSVEVNFPERMDHASSGSLSAKVSLSVGQNTFEVKASNSGGFDQKASNISLKGGGPAKLPEITIDNISTPASNPMFPNISSSTMKATVKNVTNKDQIVITVNDEEVEDWTFSPKSGKINAVLTFESGDNLIKITATNADGTTEETKLIQL